MTDINIQAGVIAQLLQFLFPQMILRTVAAASLGVDIQAGR